MKKSKVLVLLSVLISIVLVSSFVVSVYASENISVIGEHEEELRQLILKFRETVIRPAIADYLGVDIDSLIDQHLRDIICSLSEDDQSSLRSILQPLNRTFREETLKPALEGWGIKPLVFQRRIRFRRRRWKGFNQTID